MVLAGDRGLLLLALQEAGRAGGGRSEAGHILLGLLREGGGVAVLAIRERGLDPAAVEQGVNRAPSAQAAPDTPSPGGQLGPAGFRYGARTSETVCQLDS
ncbi:Clp protease N-terminal domain-containing protein [Kitasatospora sp. NPDC001175]|uniref:Clp protease N-terminal domain-containing protein n=1 Tax=Kitasatospora sp. NPDC001175 TaxID=3157103 RepID=UPI003D029234